MSYEYQTAMETLLKDIPDHDEKTLIHHELVEAAIKLDLIIQSMNSESERLISYTNIFLRDLHDERKEGITAGGSFLYGTDLTRNVAFLHTRYVERKAAMFTLTRLLLGDSNHKKFVELVKNS